LGEAGQRRLSVVAGAGAVTKSIQPNPIDDHIDVVSWFLASLTVSGKPLLL
jgi:hypothetical protein